MGLNEIHYPGINDNLNITQFPGLPSDASVIADSFPDGVTIGTVGGGSTGYPSQYGTVQTIKNGTGRVFQIFVDAYSGNGAIGQAQYRTYYAGRGWSPWTEFGEKQDAWKNIPLASGISSYSTSSTPQYCKMNNVVYLRGSVTNVPATGTIIGTLPAGYRPVGQWYYFVQNMSSNGSAQFARYSISTTGDIKLEYASSGAVFGAYWFPIATSFVAY